MIVVADTSPLNYLIQIEADNLLQQLYGQILIPAGVLEELKHPSAPAAVRAWLHRLPDWIQIRPAPAKPDLELADLGIGEQQAIQISSELGADLLLIDERKGRAAAIRRGLRTTGTLGVLLSAAQLHWIDAEQAYRRLLAETTFRTSENLEERFLAMIRSQD
jgi:predicted nucleic acid-binding protein